MKSLDETKHFHKATSLSEIIERSNIYPVIIFKYSRDCYSSERLSVKFSKKLIENTLSKNTYIYKVVVQEQPALSEKITQRFDIKHESPQIIILNKGKVAHTAHHNSINIDSFTFE